MIVIAIDALEYDLVEKFNFENLKQEDYGKTDISEFEQPRTMVLWSSFMTGENKEEEILEKGDEGMWDTQIPIDQTFFSQFDNPKVIDLPGFSYDKEHHEKERRLMKEYFEAEGKEEKERIKKEYKDHAFEHHRKLKEEFDDALEEDHDFLLFYISIADVIGHLMFGNDTIMKMIYRDLDEIAEKAREHNDQVLVLSDHGMKLIDTQYGDHNDYGFWSFSKECDLDNPEITDFSKFIREVG